MYVSLLESNHKLVLRYIFLSGAWVPAGTHAEPSYLPIFTHNSWVYLLWFPVIVISLCVPPLYRRNRL